MSRLVELTDAEKEGGAEYDPRYVLEVRRYNGQMAMNRKLEQFAAFLNGRCPFPTLENMSVPDFLEEVANMIDMGISHTEEYMYRPRKRPRPVHADISIPPPAPLQEQFQSVVDAFRTRARVKGRKSKREDTPAKGITKKR